MDEVSRLRSNEHRHCDVATPGPDLKPDWLLIGLAVFALIWIVHRAFAQSITLDEANTYRLWVAPGSPAHWEPHSNNHVLNSSLMRMSIWLFGLSELTVRAPALLGGVLYLFAAYRLCVLLAKERLFRWSLFVCFVYNPFIMDYLVAARGYSLALGFLNLATWLLVRTMLDSDIRIGCRREGLHRMASVSVCVGFSICASFTFAYASGSVLLAMALVTGARYMRERGGPFDVGRVVAAGALPAVAVLLIFAGSSIVNFPRDQLFWGTDSLLLSWKDIKEASFPELNAQLVNPLLSSLLVFCKRYLFRALAIWISVFTLLLFLARGRQTETERRSRLRVPVCLLLVLCLTVLAHWVQFKLANIPLPLERTSIFFVPLATTLLGAALSISPWDRMSRACRRIGIGILLFTGVYFIGGLRDSYFREWRIGADVKSAFPVVLDLCRRAGVREVSSDQNLASSFNFYRELYKVTEIDELRNLDTMPPDKAIYVVLESYSGDFVRTKGLEVAWRGPISDLVVLVRSGK